MDNIAPKERSRVMSRIRSKDSQIELMLRKELSKRGYRYRKNVSYLPGKPDIAFAGKKVAIFLDSCFWHGCQHHCRMPKSNIGYWRNKIERNKERDKEVKRIYIDKGWKVLRFWEHELKKDLNKMITKIEKALR